MSKNPHPPIFQSLYLANFGFRTIVCPSIPIKLCSVIFATLFHAFKFREFLKIAKFEGKWNNKVWLSLPWVWYHRKSKHGITLYPGSTEYKDQASWSMRTISFSDEIWYSINREGSPNHCHVLSAVLGTKFAVGMEFGCRSDLGQPALVSRGWGDSCHVVRHGHVTNQDVKCNRCDWVSTDYLLWLSLEFQMSVIMISILLV